MLRLHSILSLATSAGLVMACAAPKGAVESDDAAFLFPRPGRATLIVARAASVTDDDCAYWVAIDANVAGRLTPSGWVTLYPPPGSHVVSVRSSGVACSSSAEIRTRLESDQHQRLQFVRTATGALQWQGESVAR